MTGRQEATVGAGGGLYEREAELGGLASVLAAARSGAGCLAVIEGPAGIGKSRLLAEARSMAAGRGLRVATARGLDLERDVPFGIVGDLLGPLLAAAPAAERGRLLDGQAALAAALFDPAAPAVADPSALTRGLYWLTASLASSPAGDGQPAGLLLAVDDAQWADRPSLAFLVHLCARIEELPVAVVVATRTGEPATDEQALSWLRDRSDRWLMRPTVLSRGAIGELARTQMPAAEPSFIKACAEVTGGNPFLAWEVLRALRADGVAPTARSVPAVRSLVPDSVLRSVLVRLARLGEPAEKLARAVAVLGDRAPMRLARQLAGLEAVPAEEAADRLAAANILAADEPLRFTHPLIATAVHADIPAFARARAHRQAADLLTADGGPAESIAAQFLLTRPDGDQQAVRVLREAAGQALLRGDPSAAAHLLGRALAEPPAPSQQGRVLLELANARIELGDAGARQHIEAAIALLDRPAERVEALAALGRLHFNLGTHEAAARAMEEALGLLEPDSPALPALLVGYLTATTFRAGLYPQASARLQPMIEAARTGQPPRDPGLLAHLALRLAFTAEPAPRVRALAERATAGDPLVDPASLGILNGLVIQALCCVDELDEAERISGLAIAAARRRGSMLSFSMASYHRAIGRYHRGELASALADIEQSLVATREGWTAGDPWSGSLLVHIHLERGDLEAARAALAMTADAAPGTLDLAIAWHARARLALAEGRPDTALGDAEAAGQLLGAGFAIDHPGFVPWQRTAGLAALARGDTALARTRAGELANRARWSGNARAMSLALRTQAAVSPPEQRRDLLAEAADVLAGSPSALERAHALVELGAARRAAGRPSDAQGPLREGLQLADGMGAAPLVQAARRELRALGLRPRRAAVTGPDSLTPAERRVAEMAAAGLTNRQVAEALFVTVKTVETHLARGYHKLGITSRAELVNVASRWRLGGLLLAVRGLWLGLWLGFWLGFLLAVRGFWPGFLLAVGGRGDAEGVLEGGDERADIAVAAGRRGLGDGAVRGQQEHGVLQAQLGAPLREGHLGIAAEQPAEGALAGPGGVPELGQGARIGRVTGQDGGHVAQPGIGGRGQMMMQGRRGHQAAQGDAVQVGAVVRAEAAVLGERGDDLAQQLADEDNGRLGRRQRVDVGRERQRQHLGPPMRAVAVRNPGRQPHRPALRDHPGPSVGPHMQHARAWIDKLVLRVVMPVDDLAVRQPPLSRTRQRMAVYQHHKPSYRQPASHCFSHAFSHAPESPGTPQCR